MAYWVKYLYHELLEKYKKIIGKSRMTLNVMTKEIAVLVYLQNERVNQRLLVSARIGIHLNYLYLYCWVRR